MFTINKKGCKTHYDRSKGQQAFTDIMPMWLKKKKKSRGKTVLSKKKRQIKRMTEISCYAFISNSFILYFTRN